MIDLYKSLVYYKVSLSSRLPVLLNFDAKPFKGIAGISWLPKNVSEINLFDIREIKNLMLRGCNVSVKKLNGKNPVYVKDWIYREPHFNLSS